MIRPTNFGSAGSGTLAVVLAAAVGALGAGICAEALPNAGFGAGTIGRVHIVVEADDAPGPSACKLLFSAGDLTPSWGTSTMVGQWLSPHALGVGNAIYGDPCDVTVELPVGPYTVQAWHGIEYDLAQQEFNDYIQNFPANDLASNSQFYLGEIAYQQNDFKGAITAYDIVLTNYPKSFKVAAAPLTSCGFAALKVPTWNN